MTGAFLQIRSGPDSEMVPLGDDPFTIGRALGNGLTIEDLPVSRHHARIQKVGGEWAILDLDSRNGTLVNGQRLLGERTLHDHDEVRIGATTLHFRGRVQTPPPSRLLIPRRRSVVGERRLHL
jgi:pSer/pThr/pTyr-binding forkhead associated (FHA) protein